MDRATQLEAVRSSKLAMDILRCINQRAKSDDEAIAALTICLTVALLNSPESIDAAFSTLAEGLKPVCDLTKLR